MPASARLSPSVPPLVKMTSAGPASQQARHLLPRALNGSPGPLAMEVYRRRVAELLGKPWPHGREHLRRKGGGGIGIHVDAIHNDLQFTLRLDCSAALVPSQSCRVVYAVLLGFWRCREHGRLFEMNCRTIRVWGMAAAMLVGGMMVQTTAQAQTAAKAKAAARHG